MEGIALVQNAAIVAGIVLAIVAGIIVRKGI